MKEKKRKYLETPILEEDGVKNRKNHNMQANFTNDLILLQSPKILNE